MGVQSLAFIDTYSQMVTDLMVKLVEYVQAIDLMLNPHVGARSGPDATDGPNAGPVGFPTNMIIPKSIILDKDLNGYPILPDPIPSEGWKKTTWNSLFSDYLGQHYHLACGGEPKHIPYKRISEQQQDFIPNKYLPYEMIFRSPRNITLKEMETFFDHLLRRQRSHGPEDTFKFTSIKFKGDTIPALHQIDSREGDHSHQNNPDADEPPSSIQHTNPGTSGPIGTTVPPAFPTPKSTPPPTVPERRDDIPQNKSNTKNTRPKPRPITRKKN